MLDVILVPEGEKVTTFDLGIALEARAQLAARCANFFTEYDVLLCPITPTTAIPHEGQKRALSGSATPHWWHAPMGRA